MKLLPNINSKGSSPIKVSPEEMVAQPSKSSRHADDGRFRKVNLDEPEEFLPIRKPKSKQGLDNGQAISRRSSGEANDKETDFRPVDSERCEAGWSPASSSQETHSRRNSTLTRSSGEPRSGRNSMGSMQSNQSFRAAVECMLGHTKSNQQSIPAMKAGPVVTKKTVRINLLVVRRPGWSHGDEDGGEGRPGIVFGYDPKFRLATVYWYNSAQIYSHYYVGKKGDLAQPHGHSPLLDDKTGLAHPSLARQAKEAFKTFFRHMPGATSIQAFPNGDVEPGARRNSQETFSSKAQTAIIFDWDDTLFPTTYVRNDLGLSVRRPLQAQSLPKDMLEEITTNLAKAAATARQLLLLAATWGKVVLVTLARSPWVTDSCSYFYPGIGELIKSHDIQVIYAQEGEHVEYNKVNMMADEEFEAYWASMKGRAIGTALEAFYSQYDGQSWKNVISIGDSDFERLGTMAAVVKYAKEQGIMTPVSRSRQASEFPSDQSVVSRNSLMESVKNNTTRQITFEATVNGHDFKVRTKTFKMLDEPAIEELVVELTLVHQWLPLMVKLNEGFDVDLNSLDDPDRIQDIEEILLGGSPTNCEVQGDPDAS